VSGPVEELDDGPGAIGVGTIEVREGRTTTIGQLGVVRVLPTKGRRTIGPWCFVDLMSVGDVEQPPPMEIGPHPHTGLATVTWLFAGTVLHGDSLGTEQLIRPGELNLMTAGRGIAHAELGMDTAAGTNGIMGAQMWIAQTEATRHGPSAFEHHSDLPVVDLDAAEAHVLVGSFAGGRSRARLDHPAVGVDLSLRGPVDMPAEPTFEYGVVPIDHPLKVEDAIVEPGALALVPAGHHRVRIEARGGTGRVLVIGGEPLGEDITMWWNFVARTRDEITEAWQAWEHRDEDRFGPVPSNLRRMDAPVPPWVGRSQ
jgi:quercetin 2,3-dioxygenase